MTDDQDDATSPAEAIRRHIRGLRNALKAVDMANPDAAVVTDRMRGTCDTLKTDADELRFFLR